MNLISVNQNLKAIHNSDNLKRIIIFPTKNNLALQKKLIITQVPY